MGWGGDAVVSGVRVLQTLILDAHIILALHNFIFDLYQLS